MLTNAATINYQSTGVSAAAKNLYLPFYSPKLLNYKLERTKVVGEPIIFYEQKSIEATK